jgi:hypothetical protein
VRISGALARGLVVLGFAVASLVLGYLGLSVYASHHPGLGFGQGPADIFYDDLQLFVLSAPLTSTGTLPVALQVARFLAPGTTILAGVETLRVLLGEQLRSLAAARAARHAIVTGDGPAALELSRQLRAGYRKVVLVSTAAATLAQARRYGLLDVSGDPTDADTLRSAGLGRAHELFACAADSTTNAATALQALEISRESGRPLTTYAQVRDEVCGALRARRIGAASDSRFRLDFFSIEEVAARFLLDKHPLTDAGGPVARVVIVGFGSLGQAVLREIARRRPPGGPLVEVLVQHDSRQAVCSYVDRVAAIRDNCAVSFQDRTAGIVLADDAPTLMLVCLPGNDEALSAGLAAVHSVADRSDRVVICVGEPTPLDSVLTGSRALLDNVKGRLTVFDVMEEACKPDRIRAGLNDGLARAIHRGYLEACEARGESPQDNTSMRPWGDLPDDLRQANFAQALDLGAKLNSLNCVITPESGLAPDFAFTGSEIETLAEKEHERWMLERTARGYTYGPEKDDRHHPDLVDWEHLTDGAREKDRAAVRQIPRILRQAGFQILRLPPEPAAPR